MNIDYIENLIPGIGEYKRLTLSGLKRYAVIAICTTVRLAGIIGTIITGNLEVFSFYIGPTAGFELGTYKKKCESAKQHP